MDIFTWLLIGVLLLLAPAAYAGKIGAPWVPTRKRAVERVFDELEVGKNDVVIDVGAGEGKVLRVAASRGAQAVGYELFPVVWLVAWVLSWGKKNIRVVYGNFYKQSIPSDTTVVFAFLLPETMPRLYNHLLAQRLPHAQYLASYAFALKDVQPLTVIREPKCAPVYIYDIAPKQ